MAVEPHMFEEASHPFDIGGGWLALYNLYLCFIHLNTPMWNHMPQTTPSCTIKWHFAQFRTKLTLSYL